MLRRWAGIVAQVRAEGGVAGLAKELQAGTPDNSGGWVGGWAGVWLGEEQDSPRLRVF